MRRLTLLLLILGALALSGAAYATEYHVGAGQPYANMTALLNAVTLVSNDIVWVHPGTYPLFWVKTGGGSSEATAVQIRAYDMNNKPVFDAAGGTNCIDFEDPTTAKVLVGKYFLIDGLEVKNASSRGVFYVATNLIMRHCYVHNNYNGMMGGNHNCRTAALGFSPSEEGNLIAEYNEFTQNGSGSMYHQIYAQSAYTQFRYNWVHDETGGSGWKDRSTNSLLEYDWIEQGPSGNYTLEIGGPDDNAMPDTPETITLTGCVVTKNAGNNVWLFIENTRSLQGVRRGQNLGYMYLYELAPKKWTPC